MCVKESCFRLCSALEATSIFKVSFSTSSSLVLLILSFLSLHSYHVTKLSMYSSCTNSIAVKTTQHVSHWTLFTGIISSVLQQNKNLIPSVKSEISLNNIYESQHRCRLQLDWLAETFSCRRVIIVFCPWWWLSMFSFKKEIFQGALHCLEITRLALFSFRQQCFIFKRDILTLTGSGRGGTFVTLLLSPAIFRCRGSQMVRFSAHMVVFLRDHHSWPAWQKNKKQKTKKQNKNRDEMQRNDKSWTEPLVRAVLYSQIHTEKLCAS